MRLVIHGLLAILLCVTVRVSVIFGLQEDNAAAAQPPASSTGAKDVGNGTEVENAAVLTQRSANSDQPDNRNADSQRSPPYQAVPNLREPPFQPNSRPNVPYSAYNRGINYLNETIFPDGADDLTPYSRLRGPETRGPNSNFQYQDPLYFSAPLYSQQNPIQVPTYSAPLYPPVSYQQPTYRAPYQVSTRPIPYQKPHAQYDSPPIDFRRYGPPPIGPYAPTVGYNAKPYRVPYRNYTSSSSYNLERPIRRPYGAVNYPAPHDVYDRPYYLRPDHDPYGPVYFDDLDWDEEDDGYGDISMGYQGIRKQRSGRRGFADAYDDRYRRGYRYRKNRKYRDDDFEFYGGRNPTNRYSRPEYQDEDDEDRYYSHQDSRRSKNSRYDKDIRYDKNYRYDKDYDFDYSKDSYDATTDFDNRFNPKIIINNHYESYSDNDEYRDNTYSQSSYDSRNRKDVYSSSATQNHDHETYIAPSRHYYPARRISEVGYPEPVAATKPAYSYENRNFSPNTSYLLTPVSALQRTNSYRKQPGLRQRVFTNETYGNRTLYRGEAKRSANAIKDPWYNETAETNYPKSFSLDGGRRQKEKYGSAGESVFQAPRHHSAFAPDYHQSVENTVDATGTYASLPDGTLREIEAQNTSHLRPGYYGDNSGDTPGPYPQGYRSNSTLAYGKRITFGEEYGNNSKGGYNSYKPYMVRLNRAPYTRPEIPQSSSRESPLSTRYDPYLAELPYRKRHPDLEQNLGQNQTNSNSDFTYRKLKRVKNQKPVEDIPYPESAAVNPEHIGDTWEGKMTSGKSSEEVKS